MRQKRKIFAQMFANVRKKLYLCIRKGFEPAQRRFCAERNNKH